MSIERRKMDSAEMQKVIKFVKGMTKSLTFDENMDKANWPKSRKRNNFFYSLMPKQKGVKFKKVNTGSAKALLSVYGEPDENNIILYIHGGGFVSGNAFVTKSYCSMLAKYTNCRVYSAEYALAPEHPFPEGFNDCCDVFEDIMKRHPAAKITLIGESAGGNYSLAIALKYKDYDRISCIIVNSPTVDFSGKVDHSINENKDFIVKKGCLEPLKSMYVRENNPKNPYISPIYGDFSGFPPVFITCDINETLYADSVALYEKCKEAGVTVRMVEAEGTYHAFAVSGTNTPETLQILNEHTEFIKKYSL